MGVPFTYRIQDKLAARIIVTRKTELPVL